MPLRPEDHGPGRSSSGLYRQLYPMRILGTTACIVIAWLYVAHFGQIRLWYGVLLGLILCYPHVCRKLAARLEAREKLELGTVLMDAFVLGSTVYVVGFSPVPTLALLTVAFSNGMALGGVKFMSLSVGSTLVGILLPMAFYGANYHPRDQVAMDLCATFFLLFYFILFAWVAYRRSILLKQSRRELVQQKLAVEIEKKKSDSLMWAILPAAVAAKFEKQGTVDQPQAYDQVTLLMADGYEFHCALKALEPVGALAELNHCFKAFDKIVTRHRLEPLKTVGDAYFAIGGGPKPNPRHAPDAVWAAIEMRNFVTELKASRSAADRPGLDFRFAVHTGPIIGGVVSAHKFSFDVWGQAMGEIVQVERSGGPGEVMISKNTRALLDNDFETIAARSVETGTNRSLTVYTVPANSNPSAGESRHA